MKNKNAVWSFILGLISIVIPLIGFIIGIIAIILGIKGLKSKDRGFAIAGIILGIIGCLGSLLIGIIFLGIGFLTISSISSSPIF
jgi:hypothetical protein